MRRSGRAVLAERADGKPRLLDNGVWRFIGGTGGLAGVKGAGTMHIKAVSATEREFSFEGELLMGAK